MNQTSGREMKQRVRVKYAGKRGVVGSAFISPDGVSRTGGGGGGGVGRPPERGRHPPTGDSQHFPIIIFKAEREWCQK